MRIISTLNAGIPRAIWEPVDRILLEHLGLVAVSGNDRRVYGLFVNGNVHDPARNLGEIAVTGFSSQREWFRLLELGYPPRTRPDWVRDLLMDFDVLDASDGVGTIDLLQRGITPGVVLQAMLARDANEPAPERPLLLEEVVLAPHDRTAPAIRVTRDAVAQVPTGSGESPKATAAQFVAGAVLADAVRELQRRITGVAIAA